ncbi:MAG: tetratricopeptide repeat protein [Ignavibacteria bacterium]|nr:tetratricopeptide repeat protein [Ignavibacteria bacterium]
MRIGALTTLGDLYSRKKDYDKANSYYKKALAADPENIEVMLAQAKNLTKAGKPTNPIMFCCLQRL